MVNLEKLNEQELSAYFEMMEASADVDLRILKLHRTGLSAHYNYLCTRKRRNELDRFIKFMINQIETNQIPSDDDRISRVFALWSMRINIDRELMRYDGFRFYCYAILVLAFLGFLLTYIAFVSI